LGRIRLVVPPNALFGAELRTRFSPRSGYRASRRAGAISTPSDVARLLRERPKALGLTVPGMPLGSPGMETPNGRAERYQTLLLLAGGKTRVFAQHG
jgi:hypothetical protein